MTLQTKGVDSTSASPRSQTYIDIHVCIINDYMHSYTNAQIHSYIHVQYTLYIQRQKACPCSLSGYVLQRTCTNDSSAVTIDRCEKLGTNSKKYFLSQNRCCLLTPNTTLPGDNRRFDQMSCGCQADNCNGNVPYPVMPTSSNSNMSPSLVGCQCQLIVSVMLLCTAFALKFLEIQF